jgi:hypothetical protein
MSWVATLIILHCLLTMMTMIVFYRCSVLRISRFEREGGSLGTIADQICRKFGITPELLKERHRGGAASDARKAFAYVGPKNSGRRLESLPIIVA